MHSAFEQKESGGSKYPVCALSDRDGSRHLCPPTFAYCAIEWNFRS